MTVACKGVLAAAMRGNRIDIGHPDAVAYREKRLAKLKAATGAPPPDHAPPPQPPPPPAPGQSATMDVPGDLTAAPDDLGELVDWPLGRLLDTYGSAIRFYDWLRALKEIEAVNEKRIKNATQEGKLISRELVKSAILSRIEGVFIKLLTDGATTISARAFAMCKAGEDEREIKKMVEDQLSSFIRPAKQKMREALGDAGD